MNRAWFSQHRSLALTALSSVVVTAVIATAAIVSTGYSAEKIDLQDASVWVANSAESAVGRINTEVRELNSVVPAVGSETEILQDGSTVLIVDRSDATINIVDPATSTVSDSVPLPPNDPQVFLTRHNSDPADATVVIVARATGELWTVPLGALATFDAEDAPALTLGADVVTSMDESGQIFVYSPDTAAVYGILADDAGTVTSTDPLEVGDDAELSITSVGGRWAVLDSRSLSLHTLERTIDVSTSTGTPALQQATQQAGPILLADATTLMSIPFEDEEETVLLTDQSGAPARPLLVNNCVFAAFSGGNAWRSCDNQTPQLLPLAGLSATADLTFASNSGRVVLNDTASGNAWAVQATGQLIDNWASLIPDSATEQVEDTGSSVPPVVEQSPQPPVAVDDAFGARPGRTTPLPVLLNDYDANGDVLTIDATSPLESTVGGVDVIADRQRLQITLPDDASGVISFDYTISDGRGGTSTATVAVTVRSPDENSAPVQVRATTTTVAAYGRATISALGDWVDPDGDPFYLADASVREPDTVSFKPGGAVIFSDADGGASATIALTVSDGALTSAGSIDVVIDSATVPIIADPFVVLAAVDEEVTVSPLEHVRGGSGALRLNSVPAKPSVTVTPSYESGTFRFVSATPGTHYLDYVVTDGDQSVTATIRVEVAAAELNTTPVTIPKTVFVQSLSTEQVDVAGTDIDPAGGVLVVTGIASLAAESGVAAEVLEQRFVRVRLDAPLDGPVRFNYLISNGLAEATGEITVIEIPAPATLQPPIAMNDEITVRVGAAINIPVLANDQHPDGAELTLLPTLAQDLPADAGLLFTAGSTLRYLAPDRTGNFVAIYEIEGSDGQRARAEVRINVREANVDTNSAPVPRTVQGRVLAGATVEVPIPLSGIDPDGDTVQLLGQDSSPERGEVIAVGPSSITYRAGDYSAGTDTFRYAVIDDLGARAVGTVQVGISARLDGARNPVATIDEVTTRPGSTVSVQVLSNDTDPDGRVLSVVSAVSNDDSSTVTVDGDLVVISPGATPGVYGAVYTIENDVGGTSSNFVRVTVDPDAPLSRPVITDTVLTLSDVGERDEVTVDVLGNVFFADGNPRSLILSVQPGFEESARVTSAGLIRVNRADSSQIIPFRATHPSDASVYSYGFIWVPGFDDALPQLNRNAPALSVVSEEPLRINLAEYVLVTGDRQPSLTDASLVRATHGNGAALVVDDNTLVFTSADRYFGSASISFEVTDARDATDPSAHTATLVLPITVLPRENQPPVFSGAVIDIEPAEERTIDLTRLTTYPYPDDADELAYTIESIPEGFTYAVNGSELTLRANDTVPIGSQTAMTVGVRDAMADGRPGRIQLSVVPSTRPLARASTDTAIVRRGETTTIDVLANDAATNPFPGSALTVTAIRGLDSASLPAGVRVTPSADRNTLVVDIADTAAPTDTALQYQVTDATGDPSRAVWGTVRISVQDRPDPVTTVRVTDLADEELTVAWNGGAFNNSPITGYRAVVTSAETGAVISQTECGGSPCDVATGGNGSANAVRVAVTATNAIGASDATSTATRVWSDVVPLQPAALASSPVDGGLRIMWNKPASSGGSPITRYVVTVGPLAPQEIEVPAGDDVGTSYETTITDSRLVNGSNVTFTVSARNDATESLVQWTRASATGTPAGAPIRASAPSATVTPDEAGQATLAWAGAFSDNGRPISNYYAAVFTGDVPTCTVRGTLPGTIEVPAASDTFASVGTQTQTTFTNLDANTTYRFAVFAFNGMGCTDSVVVEATPRERPGTVTAATISEPLSSGAFTWDHQIATVTVDGSSDDISAVMYRFVADDVEGSQHGPQPLGSFLLSTNGSHYGSDVRVQVKACATYSEFSQPLCSAEWSEPLPVGVAIANTVLGGLDARLDDAESETVPATTGQYSFTSSPEGQYNTVAYSCGAGAVLITDGEAGECDVTSTSPTDGAPPTFPDLTVTITVDGVEYPRDYRWTDYD